MLTPKENHVIMRPVKQRKEWKNMRYLFTSKKAQLKEKHSAVEVVTSNVFHDFNIG